MDFLQVSDAGKQMNGEWIVRGIHFRLAAGHKLAIAGETGSGKSTLLKIAAGLITPDEGDVYFEKVRLKKVPAEKLIPGHEGISYLSQHFELPQHLTVQQALSYSNELSEHDAEALYRVCRIQHLLTRKTSQLSGGEKQRIALARLLIHAPRLLILDEPFSNLDPGHRDILKSVIRDIGRRLQITCILVSHDPRDTLSWADEIAVMKNGRIVQQDSPLSIYRHPVSAYVAGLFGKFFTLDASLIASLGLPGDAVNNFWRPEDFAIAENPGSGVAARVVTSSFMGNGYEIELVVAHQLISVYAPSPVETGKEVYVSVNR